MKRLINGLLIAMSTTTANVLSADDFPDGFVDLYDVIPDLHVELAYYSADNFVGEVVDGYGANRAIMTAQAARALRRVAQELRGFDLGLKIFDAYRPQRAVNHFIRWARDLQHTQTKTRYYPGVDKSDLFKQGYIAARSSHSRGSTLDLTLVSLQTGKSLDMGTRFDFFGPESWPSYREISTAQRANRLLLRTLMESHGFTPYLQEWWHFTLQEEPFPDTYFDFEVR